ncbi:MAG: strawberry notch C-terminal domain-containing protein [Chloracidobacterium sp.]|nr:strawberry notch C-terminal domain-containing protein [Chloracidobacterium sp.]
MKAKKDSSGCSLLTWARAALNVVLTRIMNGQVIPNLEDPKRALDDMALVKKGSEGREEISESEKTNIPRFLNRLLSLEVDRQNALFDYFYQTFLETIEHLKSKGKIDDGMEDLKAISVMVAEPPHVLHSDPLTGAQTVYYKLELTVATHPAKFDELSLNEYIRFYQNRSNDSYVAVRATLSHTDPETGDRFQMFSVSRPAGYNLSYIRENELVQKYKLVPKSRAESWWLYEESKIPASEKRTVHLLSGALLPIWKHLNALQQTGLNIVRTTTNDGMRLVGVNISAECITEIRKHFGIWRSAATTAEEILKSVNDDYENIDLLGDIKVRKTRFQGTSVVEVYPSTSEQIREFRETELINIVQNGKQRFFVPENEEIANIAFGKLLKMYPPVHLLQASVATESDNNFPPLDYANEPVVLPTWIIEPLATEVALVSTQGQAVLKLVN